MRKIPIPTIITASALVLVLVAYAVTFIVRFNEVAVRVRMGKADRNDIIAQPGLYFRWPWPIESVVKYDKRLHALDTPETEIKTRDGNNLIVGCYAIWQIQEPYDFYVRVQTEAAAEEKLRARVNEVRAAVIGNKEMASFVSLDPEQVDRTYNEIEQEMVAGTAPGAAADFGIKLVSINVRRISLPEEATQTVFQSMIDEREALAAQYRGQGKSIADAIRGTAESAANSIKSFADAKAEEVRSAGMQAATRTLGQIGAADQGIFVWLRQMEALEAALRERTTIFFDAKEQLFKSFAAPPLDLGGMPSPGESKDEPAVPAKQP